MRHDRTANVLWKGAKIAMISHRRLHLRSYTQLKETPADAHGNALGCTSSVLAGVRSIFGAVQRQRHAPREWAGPRPPAGHKCIDRSRLHYGIYLRIDILASSLGSLSDILHQLFRLLLFRFSRGMIKNDRPSGRSFCRLGDRDLFNRQPLLGRSEGVGRRCIVGS